ncbi:unnamed protein product, partial [Polarella glacialis]
ATPFTVLNPSSKGNRCVAGTCSKEDDKLCCYDKRTASMFKLDVRMKKSSGGVLVATWGKADAAWDKLNFGSDFSKFEAGITQTFQFAGIGPLSPPQDKLCLQWQNDVNSGPFYFDVVTLRDVEGKVLAEMKDWPILGGSGAKTACTKPIPWKQN